MIRFFAFEAEHELRVGFERDGTRHDITRGIVRDFGKRELIEFLREDQLDALITAVEKETLLLEEMPATFTWLPPILRPGKIVAMIQNYRKHAEEFGNTPPSDPTWFSKLNTSLTGHGQPINVPEWVDGRVDHEVELGVIVGATVKEVTQADAPKAVAGYTIVNDVSARRIQGADRENKHPWLRSKSFDTFTPMGPYFVPSRFVSEAQALGISCRVNNEIRQNGNTRDMIHPVAKIVAEMSRWMTLEPGDVICTGTPEGVYNMKGGDVCDCEIEGLGTLSNPVERKPKATQ